MKPSNKSDGITNFLEEVFGRSTAINENRCIAPPIGCGGPAINFRDEVSRKEYAISGFCQTCQDKIFGGYNE